MPDQKHDGDDADDLVVLVVDGPVAVVAVRNGNAEAGERAEQGRRLREIVQTYWNEGGEAEEENAEREEEDEC